MSTPPAPSALDGVETLVVGAPRSAPRRWAAGRLVLLVTVAALVVLYLVAVHRTVDRLPRDTRVGGVAVGGMSHAAAERKVFAALGPGLDKPFQVKIDSELSQVAVAETGLDVDWARSVQVPSHGGRYDPRQVWWVLHGGSSVPLVVDVDQRALTDLIARMAQAYDNPPVDADFSYEGPGGYEVGDGADGVTLDRAGAAEALQRGYLRHALATVTLPVTYRKPAVDLAAAQRVVDRYADRAVSAAIVVRVPGGRLRLSPSLIRRSLTFVPQGHELVPHLDGRRLLAGAEGSSRTTVSAAELAAAATPALTRTGAGRTVTIAHPSASAAR